MLAKVFRTLGGLLSVMFFSLLAFTPMGNGPTLGVALVAVVAAVFGLYAVMGEEVANMWIGAKTVKVRHPDDTGGPP